MGDGELGAKKRSAQVDGHGAIPRLDIQFVDTHAAAANPGIVDQDVDSSKATHRPPDEFAHLLGFGNITRHKLCLSTGRPNTCSGRLARVSNISDHHRRASAARRVRSGASNAPGTPGYDHHLAAQKFCLSHAYLQLTSSDTLDQQAPDHG
jgi:hypothetical protein